MYRIELRKHLRAPGFDYKHEKQEVLQKKLELVLKQVSDMAVQMVIQQAPINPDSVTRRGLELREIDGRLKIEMLLQKARVLTFKTTKRKRNQEKTKDAEQKNTDNQEDKSDGKRGSKKRKREDHGKGLSSGKRTRT